MQGRLRRILSLVLALGLLFQQVSFAQVAVELNIADHLAIMGNRLVTEKFRPLHLRYFSYDLNSANFKVLVDKGDFAKGKGLLPKGTVPEQKLQEETKTLLDYFLVGVTLPDEAFWVNLRPDSESQIIDPYLEQTDVGKIMLEADLQLKKDTARMTSPETPEGRQYWNRLYKKAEELYGYATVTIPTLTRPWIVPGEIIVRESQDSAYVYKAVLRVMLEQDYLKSSGSTLALTYSFKDERAKALNEYSSQLIRELIIPRLTKEINSSKRYAALRQVYYSLILSRWFKNKFADKKGLLPQGTVPSYIDRINTLDLAGLTSKSSWSKAAYFKQYRKSFSDGEYNVKEPVYTPTGQVIRSYFSGGIQIAGSPINNRSGVVSSEEFSAGRLSKFGYLMEGNSAAGIGVSAGSPLDKEKESTALPIAELQKRLIVRFSEVDKNSVDIVGGKGANLGELKKVKEISVPDGIAVTTKAFKAHLEEGVTDGSSLNRFIEQRLKNLDYEDSMALGRVGEDIRRVIMSAKMPSLVEEEIRQWYQKLCDESGVADLPVAVRSSATAEDTADASFAGQQDTYLNIRGIENVLDAVKRNWASLFTDRAIYYRHEQGIDHAAAFLSVVIQKMIESRESGTAFSVDTGTGFPATSIDAAWGLGEGIVSGTVNPDSYIVKKDDTGRPRIYRRNFGKKLQKVVYREGENLIAHEATVVLNTSYDERHSFSLAELQVLEVAKAVEFIHNHYGMYMDIEWAFDKDGKLWILQARPETIWNKWEKEAPNTVKMENTVVPRRYATKAYTLLSGVAQRRAARGKVVILDATKTGMELAQELNKLKKGDVLVTTMTKPDMVPVMKRAAAIVTDEGGPTCHAAIVARELKIPAIVGTTKATKVLRTGEEIIADANRGKVYKDDPSIVIEKIEDNVHIPSLPKTDAKIYVTVSNPFEAMSISGLSKFVSHGGVGLQRKEFVDTTEILVHPLAGIAYDMYRDPSFKDEEQKAWIRKHIIEDEDLKAQIEDVINGYPSYTDFYIDKLSKAIAIIAAIQEGKGQRVKFRTTDFKTNEYREQIGGPLFEPQEKNPMMGYRGINRMLSAAYKRAFELEIEAIKEARKLQKNIDVMFPVVRTPEELKEAIDLFAQHGLVRGEEGFQIGMMVEVPANVFQDEFYDYIDFMSIGSNDMTQFVLGFGRDNAKTIVFAEETNPAVLKALEIVIKKAKEKGVTTGICGQRPSNDPEYAAFLVGVGIDSISVTADAYKAVVQVVSEQEKKLAGKEFNPEVSGWEIPESAGNPQVIKAEEVHASETIKQIGIHPLKAYKEDVIEKVYQAIMEKVGTTPSDVPIIFTTDDLDVRDYELLQGSEGLELLDENPQLGFSGLVRVVDPEYGDFFLWQLQGVKEAREDSGRKNIGIRLNLVRTLPEAQKALEMIKSQGLIPGRDGFMVGMEIAGPASVLLIDEFINLGLNFLSENTARFLSYDLAIDPGNPNVRISQKEKEADLVIPHKIWTAAAERHNIPLIQAVEPAGPFKSSSEKKEVSSALSQAPKTVSSPTQAMPETPGGIDFRALPLTVQPMGSFKGLDFNLPKLSRAELEGINIDLELEQLKNMVQSGTIPSGQRIKELIAACRQKGEINARIDSLLLCLIDVFKLEEENASESSAQLKEALAIVDSIA
ncbi:MAG: phosphoenolpyruvate synthase [Candidatus Omnitrophica bacterium]|nr:phosphoenolpyruvate synthase [Candidatus Omnitrophota bacterium]